MYYDEFPEEEEEENFNKYDYDFNFLTENNFPRYISTNKKYYIKFVGRNLKLSDFLFNLKKSSKKKQIEMNIKKLMKINLNSKSDNKRLIIEIVFLKWPRIKYEKNPQVIFSIIRKKDKKFIFLSTLFRFIQQKEGSKSFDKRIIKKPKPKPKLVERFRSISVNSSQIQKNRVNVLLESKRKGNQYYMYANNVVPNYNNKKKKLITKLNDSFDKRKSIDFEFKKKKKKKDDGLKTVSSLRDILSLERLEKEKQKKQIKDLQIMKLPYDNKKFPRDDRTIRKMKKNVKLDQIFASPYDKERNIAFDSKALKQNIMKSFQRNFNSKQTSKIKKKSILI